MSSWYLSDEARAGRLSRLAHRIAAERLGLRAAMPDCPTPRDLPPDLERRVRAAMRAASLAVPPAERRTLLARWGMR